MTIRRQRRRLASERREELARLSDMEEAGAGSPAYCIRIAPHYSGLISAHLPDFPGLVVLGRDHDEATELARTALEQELERLISEDLRVPQPRARGTMTIATRKPG